MSSTQDTTVKNKLKTVLLYLRPISELFNDKIPSSNPGSKVYLTRIDVPLENLQIIKKSTPLFRYYLEEDDENVENDEDELHPKISAEIDPEFHNENSNIVQSGKDYIAKEEGLFVIDNHKPKIVPVNLHGSGDVKISEDSMKVNVDIYPSIDDYPIPSVEEILTKISSLDITADINKTLLEEKLKLVETDKCKILNICVAEGKPQVNGIDGRLENCTNKKEDLENLNFDEFHKVNPIISVKDGETIAIIHQPTEGEEGINVFGKPVPPIPGKEFKIKLGSNTKFSEEDPNCIIAKQDGFLNLSDESISITDTFTVNGDIDFKSGNIISKGSLKVSGNVNSGFTLNLTKDVEVNGYVGDAKIESGKNIIIHGGFLGKGKGILKAEGDVEVKFVENQKVLSRGSISISKEGLNAQIFAKHKITGKGNAVIVGGHTIAGDEIEISSLGNSTEAETIVEVGFDYEKRNSITDNKEKLITLRKSLENVDKYLFEFAQMKKLTPKNAEKVKVLANEHKKIVAETEAIKEENLKLTNEIYVPTSSKISVKGSIYPGVKIGINGRFMIVKEPMRSKTFVLSKDNEVIAL